MPKYDILQLCYSNLFYDYFSKLEEYSIQEINFNNYVNSIDLFKESVYECFDFRLRGFIDS